LIFCHIKGYALFFLSSTTFEYNSSKSLETQEEFGNCPLKISRTENIEIFF